MNNMLLNPQGLSQLGQVPLMYTNQAYDWMKQAQGADQATLADIMAQRQRQAQLAPIQQQQAEATLAQTQLGNTKQGYDNRVREATLEDRVVDGQRIPGEISAKISKFAAEVDEERWKSFQAKVNLGASQGDPKMVAIMKQMPAWQAERQKHLEAMEKAREETRRARSTATIGANAKVTSATLPKPTKLSTDPWEAYAQLAMQLATLEPNSPEAQNIAKQMQAIQIQAQEVADQKAAGKFTQDPSGKWVPRKAPALPGPAAPAPQPAPGPQAPRPSPMQFNPAQMQWIQNAKKANPGMSDADIIAEGKRRGKL